jgi:hypothetical protein
VPDGVVSRLFTVNLLETTPPEIPINNNQTPNKFKNKNKILKLEIGIYLELASWNLEFSLF